jgi:hypothetical protein
MKDVVQVVLVNKSVVGRRQLMINVFDARNRLFHLIKNELHSRVFQYD